ncbi:MAG: hypothetical protein JW751_06405 [Polyangiaceae bacterium]|nr:hypothetical protein [Polyangiaceae bacterium]
MSRSSSVRNALSIGAAAVLSAFAAVVAAGYFAFRPARRRESIRLYRILFPRASFVTLLNLTWRQFQSFARIYAEERLLTVPGWIRMESQGREHILDAVRDHGAAVLVMSHLGSPALAARVLASVGTSLTMVKGTRQAAEAERTASDEHGLRVEIRPPAAGSATIVELLDRVRSGEVVSLAGDRAWVEGSRQLPVVIANHVARVTAAPFALAMTARVPALVCFAVRSARRSYAFECLPPLRLGGATPAERTATLARAAAEYAAALEARIRAFPEQWHTFERFLFEPAAEARPTASKRE